MNPVVGWPWEVEAARQGRASLQAFVRIVPLKLRMRGVVDRAELGAQVGLVQNCCSSTNSRVAGVALVAQRRVQSLVWR